MIWDPCKNHLFFFQHWGWIVSITTIKFYYTLITGGAFKEKHKFKLKEVLVHTIKVNNKSDFLLKRFLNYQKETILSVCFRKLSILVSKFLLLYEPLANRYVVWTFRKTKSKIRESVYRVDNPNSILKITFFWLNLKLLVTTD